MTPTVEVQRVCDGDSLPEDESFQRWAELVLGSEQRQGYLVIRLVDSDESRQLNSQYRHKDKPTNVLSFPFETPGQIKDQIDDNYLGDLVICVPVVQREATEQHKPENWHWAHLVIHGMLHLLGYDHQQADEAEQMEQREIGLLQQLGIDNPYEPET